MTRTRNSTTSNGLAARRRYRRLLAAFLLGGVGIGLLLREGLGYPLLGEAAYWLGIIGFLAVLFGTPVSLFDERDVALERRASHLTLTLAAVALVLAASAARVVPQVTAYSVPDAVRPALYAVGSLYVVFVAVYLLLRVHR